MTVNNNNNNTTNNMINLNETASTADKKNGRFIPLTQPKSTSHHAATESWVTKEGVFTFNKKQLLPNVENWTLLHIRPEDVNLDTGIQAGLLDNTALLYKFPNESRAYVMIVLKDEVGMLHHVSINPNSFFAGCYDEKIKTIEGLNSVVNTSTPETRILSLPGLFGSSTRKALEWYPKSNQLTRKQQSSKSGLYKFYTGNPALEKAWCVLKNGVITQVYGLHKKSNAMVTGFLDLTTGEYLSSCQKTSAYSSATVADAVAGKELVVAHTTKKNQIFTKMLGGSFRTKLISCTAKTDTDTYSLSMISQVLDQGNSGLKNAFFNSVRTHSQVPKK